MIARPTRWIASAVLFLFVTGIALAFEIGLTLSAPTSNAQVGVYYSSGFTVLNQTTGPYTVALSSGALPPGLNLSQPSGSPPFAPLTGTPLPAASGNTYNFTIQLTDSVPMSSDSTSPSGPDSQAAARRRALAQSGSHTASVYPSFSITVAPAAPSSTPVPPSAWMAMTGLAGAGLFRLRQKRRG
jgi:hypothetical protein